MTFPGFPGFQVERPPCTNNLWVEGKWFYFFFLLLGRHWISQLLVQSSWNFISIFLDKLFKDALHIHSQSKVRFSDNFKPKGCTSESEIPLVALKLRVTTYFELLITNMTTKIGANDIFKVKTKKNLIFHVFHNITSINIGLRKTFRTKLGVCENEVSSNPVIGWITEYYSPGKC